MPSYTEYTAVIRATRPVAHGDTRQMANASNHRAFMRIKKRRGGRTVLTPDFSGNAMRHNVFRDSLANHLTSEVGVTSESIPYTVADLLWDGGERGTAATPANEGALAHAVRQAFPSLDLLSGCTDKMLLGAGRLKVACWPLAVEYMEDLKWELEDRPDLLKRAEGDSVDERAEIVTRTRRSKRGFRAKTGKDGEVLLDADGDPERESSQMIHAYEVLTSGIEVVLKLTLTANTPDLTRSALGVAFEEWDLYFGGRSTEGMGKMVIREKPEIDTGPYRAYVRQNADELRRFLQDGTLGANTVLCGA